jgi:aryl-alcohol dehydrogenase-like predicted oxidoreductase
VRASGWSETGSRQGTDEYGKKLYNDFPEPDRLVIEAVGKVAAARGVPRAQVALAWVLQKKGRDRADRQRLEGGATD